MPADEALPTDVRQDEDGSTWLRVQTDPRLAKREAIAKQQGKGLAAAVDSHIGQVVGHVIPELDAVFPPPREEVVTASAVLLDTIEALAPHIGDPAMLPLRRAADRLAVLARQLDGETQRNRSAYSDARSVFGSAQEVVAACDALIDQLDRRATQAEEALAEEQRRLRWQQALSAALERSLGRDGPRRVDRAYARARADLQALEENPPET